MVVTDRPTVGAGAGGPVVEGAEPRGFRPRSRRRARIAAGAVLAAFAVGGNVLVYSSLDDRTEVLQVVRNVRAGELVTADDVRAVAVDLDRTVPSVAADDAHLVVGQYARTYLASGTLIVDQLVQPTPLVSAGTGVVAVEVHPSRVPSGLRERSQVQLVVVDDRATETFVTVGRVVARSSDPDGVSGAVSLSVEVADDAAPIVAAGDDVRVVLVDPGADPALEVVTDEPVRAPSDEPSGEAGG